jgi:hypothetical protein
VTPGELLGQVIVPLVLVAAVGAVLQARGVEVTGLMRVTALALTPALVFSRLSTTDTSAADLGLVLVAAIGPAVAVGVVLHAALGATLVRSGRVADRDRRLAVVAGILPNMGNFGLPLARALERAGDGMDDAVTTQTALIVGANVLLWVLAPVYVRLVGSRSGWREGRRLLPILVALAVAALVNVAGWTVPTALGEPIGLLADACVPVMLLALGGSVVVLARGPAAERTWLVPAAVATKVALVPLAVWAWVGPLGLWPDPGYHLVLAMAAPAAVMVSQLAPVGGEGGTAVVERVIVWSTLLSCVSLPVAGAVLSAAG